MRDQSAFLKLSFVKAELSRLLTARQITNDEFVTASRMIELEEQRLINELPQMGAVFLQAVNELKSMGLPEELANKLQNSYLSDSEVAADSGEDTAVLQQPEEIAQEQEDNESEEILPTQILTYARGLLSLIRKLAFSPSLKLFLFKPFRCLN